jgi:uncharacterized SAM-binding protein YcdF (DUF218 family)
MKPIVFSNILQTLLLPPGINIVFFSIGFILLFLHWQLIGYIFILCSFLSLWLFSTLIIASQLISVLQNLYPPIPENQLSKSNIPTAIVILGGGSSQAPEYNNQFIVSPNIFARLRYGVFLYKKTHYPMLVSGGRNPDETEETRKSQAFIMDQELQRIFNVSAQWKEDQSATTQDEAHFILPILEKMGSKKFI